MVYESSYFDFGSPQQQVDMHFNLFLPYLLNSQMIPLTINFSKLISGDWSIGLTFIASCL